MRDAREIFSGEFSEEVEMTRYKVEEQLTKTSEFVPAAGPPHDSQTEAHIYGLTRMTEQQIEDYRVVPVEEGR